MPHPDPAPTRGHVQLALDELRPTAAPPRPRRRPLESRFRERVQAAELVARLKTLDDAADAERRHGGRS